jgi:RNA polymerase sigma factor (sigma-70 family)
MESHLPHELLLANQAFLQRLARSLVADPASAEDLVQDTSLAALRRPPHASGSARAWLARVMRNLAASRARGDAHRRAREADVARPERDDLGAQLSAHLEVQRRLVEAVARLDEPYRSTILLRYVHDLSAAEIAERLATPVATVRTRLARALERLRRDLDARNEPGTPIWSVVLLAGLIDLRPMSVSAATAAGGAIVAAKLVWIGGAVAVAALGGTLWILREPQVPEAVAGTMQLESPDETIATDSPVLAARDVASEVSQEQRVAVTAPNSPPEVPEPAPDWGLELELRGWDATDEGTVKVELRRTDSKEPGVVRDEALAERLVLDVGELLRASEGRPDRLSLQVDHPDFLPVQQGMFVPQELLVPDAVGGQLQALVDLERTSAVLSGKVEIADPTAHLRARVAAYRLDDGSPAAKPIEVVRLDESGRYRLRVGGAPVWVVVAWLLPERGGSRARPASLRLDGPLRGEIELVPLVLDPGAVVEGRIVKQGNVAPPPGSIFIHAATNKRNLDDGLAWQERSFELQHIDQEWKSDGSFRFEGLAPGPYRLQWATLGMREGQIPKLQVGGTTTAAVDVTAPVRDLLVPFDRVQFLLEVSGADGPVSRAKVMAHWSIEGGSRGAGTTADELGRVVLELGPSDTVELEGTDAAAGQGRLSIRAADLVPGQRVELRLLPLDGPQGTLRLRGIGNASGIPSDGGMNAYFYDLEQVSPEMLSVWLTSVPYSMTSGSASIEPPCPKLKMRFEDGVWTIEDLPRTRLFLRFLPSHVQREPRWLALGDEFEIDLTEEAEIELDWEPRLGGLLRFDLSALSELKSARLTSQEGKSLTLSYLSRMQGSSGYSIGSLASSPDVYDIQPTLEAGAYRLEVTLLDKTRRSLPVQIVAGQVTDLVVRPDDL